MRFLVCTAAFAALLSAAVPATAQLKVSYVEGKAEYRAENDPSWNDLEEGQSVPESGYVRTGKASALELVKTSKVRLVFSSNTLARVKLDADPSKDRLLLHVGTVLSEVFTPGAAFQVRTETANMGVRGTQFTVEASPSGGTVVAVKKGRVYTLCRTPDNEPSGGVLVEAGQKSMGSGKTAPKAVALGSAEKKYFDFDAFDKMASGELKDLTLYDHFTDTQDAMFQEFKEQDLADYQLFVLDDLDQQWEFLLSENKAYAEQLKNAPLKN